MTAAAHEPGNVLSICVAKFSIARVRTAHRIIRTHLLLLLLLLLRAASSFGGTSPSMVMWQCGVLALAIVGAAEAEQVYGGKFNGPEDNKAANPNSNSKLSQPGRATFEQRYEGACGGKVYYSGDGTESSVFRLCAADKKCAGFFYGFNHRSLDELGNPRPVSWWMMTSIKYKKAPGVEYKIENSDSLTQTKCYSKSNNVVKGAMGTPASDSPTPSPTSMATAPWKEIGNVHHDAKWKVHHTTELTAKKTPAPAPQTPAPTTMESHVTCMNGDSEVPGNWVGAGEGSNYCNLCRCFKDGLYCTRRKCDMPLVTRERDAEICKHVTCKYDMRQNRVKVQHHHEENFQSSKCAYDRHHDKCSCTCHNKFVDYAKTLSVEYVWEIAGNARNTECRIIPFSKRFDPNHPTDVVVSPTRASHTGLATTEPLVWVERSFSTGFKLCATAQGNNAVLSTFKISAFAFQSAKKTKSRADDARTPFVGARSGASARIGFAATVHF